MNFSSIKDILIKFYDHVADQYWEKPGDQMIDDEQDHFTTKLLPVLLGEIASHLTPDEQYKLSLVCKKTHSDLNLPDIANWLHPTSNKNELLGHEKQTLTYPYLMQNVQTLETLSKPAVHTNEKAKLKKIDPNKNLTLSDHLKIRAYKQTQLIRLIHSYAPIELIKEIKDILDKADTFLSDEDLDTLEQFIFARNTLDVWDAICQQLSSQYNVPSPYDTMDIVESENSQSKLEERPLQLKDLVAKAKTFEIWKKENRTLLENLTELNLTNKKLKNIDCLNGLTSLKKLNLSDNELKNLEVIKQLEQLEEVELESNLIEDLKPLENLKKAKTLNLKDNFIHDISPLKQLNEIENLNLSYNYIQDIDCLKSLVNLKSLYLMENQIVKIDALSGLTLLEILAISENYVKDITSLTNLTKLIKLNLSHNQINSLDALQNLANVKLLNVSFNQVADLNPLKTLSTLEKLLIGNNQIGDISFLENLVNLELLNLSNNQIHNIKPLSSLNLLRNISLTNNKIKEIDCLENLANLTDIELSKNQIINIDVLSTLPNLKQVYLRKNQIESIPTLSQKSLIFLDLSQNKIKKICDQNAFGYFGGLMGLDSLQTLDVSDNQIEDIKMLRELKRLHFLSLNKNPIKIASLQYLDFIPEMSY